MVAETTAGEGMAEDRSHAMSALLARNWGLVLLRGVLALIFGVLVLIWPGIAMTTLILLFAAYMLADGIFAIVSAIRAAQTHERWGWFVFEGIADLIAGAVAFFWPGIALITLVLVLAIWAVVSGIFMIGAFFRLRPDHGRWWLGLAGLISIVWGVLLFIWPLTGAVILTIWLGAYAVAFGISLILLSLRLRSRHAAHTVA